MSNIPFSPGDRVYHADLGCFATWREAVANAQDGELTYSRVEIEDSNGRTMLCPTRMLVPAEEA
jgi:hypothetical protein